MLRALMAPGRLPLLASIAGVVVACGGPARSGDLPSSARSGSAPSSSSSVDVVPVRDPAPAASAEAPRPLGFERQGACIVRVATQHFRDVPDVALIAAVLPLARADAQDEAALELPIDQEPVWKDCHGHASNLGAQSSPASLRARVGTRLVVDQQHGYAWIAVGSSEGVLARFRLDGEKLEAIATSPDLDSQHVVSSRGLKTARIGKAEIVFRPLDLTAVDLEMKPAAPVQAEGWQAYVSQGDADFSGYGNIPTRYRDAQRMMVVTKDWSVSDDGLSVEETWWPEKGGYSLSFTRRYVLRNGELVPVSKKVPR